MKCNTFTLIARCRETGFFGAAVASKFPGVGAYSPYIEPDAGVIATQGWVNPSLGPKGMTLLKQGKTANEVLDELLFQDPGRELRQVAVMDSYGNCSVYTGIENDDVKGHLIRDDFCVLGNLLTSAEVLPAMAETFMEAKGPLAERLLAAMIKGDELGGDRRGKQSAAIRVEALEGFPYVDFRVDDHPDPVRELERIYKENKHVLIERYYEWVDSVKKGIPLGQKG